MVLRFFKGISLGLLAAAGVFFGTIGAGAVIAQNTAALPWLGYLATFLSAVAYEHILLLAMLVGLCVFLCTVFYKSGLLKCLSVLAVCLSLTVWFSTQFDTIHAGILSQAREEALEKAREDAAANIMYTGASVFEYPGLPVIQVVSDAGVSQEWVDNVVYNALYKIPSFLVEKCSSIVFMDEAHFGQEEHDADLSNVVGLASSADMTVKVLIQDLPGQYIDASMPEYIMDPIDYYLNTIVHEMGHLYDYQYAYNQEFLSDDPTFLRLYEVYGGQINDYASSNEHEFFAEGLKLYILYPQYLLSKSEAVYTYYQSLFVDVIPPGY